MQRLDLTDTNAAPVEVILKPAHEFQDSKEYNEYVDTMLRKFSRRVRRIGILKDARAKEEFIKPSVTKRAKRKRAIFNQRNHSR